VTLFAFASTHGSPGVTTTVLGLAATWAASTGRQVIVLEADPDGGVMASRFGELRADRTLADLVVGVRRSFDTDAVLSSAQRLWGGLPVVVAPPSAEQSHAALTTGGDRLAAGLAATDDLDVLVDLGRLTQRSPAFHLARRAVLTSFVCRPQFEAVASLSDRVPEIAERGCGTGLLLVGDRPYSAADVEAAVDAPVVAVLPDDPRAAGVIAGAAGSPRQLHRSLLWRSLGDLASRLVARVPPATTTGATSANHTSGPADVHSDARSGVDA
jgi:hypothetical protein